MKWCIVLLFIWSILFVSNNARANGNIDDYVGTYWSVHTVNGRKYISSTYTMTITKKGDGYFIEALAVHPRTTHILKIDKDRLKSKGHNTFGVDQCSLSVQLKSEEKLFIKHEHFCGGAGVYLDGDWEKVTRFSDKEIARAFAPEIEDRELCKKGSSYGGYVKRIILKGQEYILLDNSQLRCKGALARFSSQAGAELRILDAGTLKKLFKATVLRFNAGKGLIEVETRVKFAKCKSRIEKSILAQDGNVFKVTSVECLPLNTEAKKY